MKPVMGKTPAVILWLLTATFPHNKAISKPEDQHYGQGPCGQHSVTDDHPQDPPVWDQTTPGATRWYQDQDNGGEGLAMDLPRWQKGRLVTKVPLTHTPLIRMSDNEPHPILLYTVLIVFDRVMYVRFPTEPWVHFTSTWSFILLNTPTAAAADTGKISLYDCGATASSQPLVQQFNLSCETPAQMLLQSIYPPCQDKPSRYSRFLHFLHLQCTTA